MKHVASVAFAASLMMTPASAEEGLSLMERGAQLFFEGLMDEMEPAFRELEDMAESFEPALRGFAEDLGPALQGLLDTVEDWSAYEPPVVLPNGDILLKRKPVPAPDSLPAPQEGEIDI